MALGPPRRAIIGGERSRWRPSWHSIGPSPRSARSIRPGGASATRRKRRCVASPRSEERRVGKSVDLGGRRSIKKKKKKTKKKKQTKQKKKKKNKKKKKKK